MNAIPLRRKRDLETQPYCAQDGDTLMQHLLESGYAAHPADVAWAWYQHSDDRCATWLSVDEDDREYNVSSLLAHLEPAV